MGKVFFFFFVFLGKLSRRCIFLRSEVHSKYHPFPAVTGEEGDQVVSKISPESMERICSSSLYCKFFFPSHDVT